MKKLLGISFVVLGVFIAYISFDGQSQSLNVFQFGSDPIDREATRDVSTIGTIQVKAHSTNLNIISDDRKELYAHLHGNSNTRHSLNTEINGNALEITVESDDSWLSFGFDSLKLDVYIPEKYAEQLELEVSSGNITIEGPFDLETLSTELSSGNTTIENVTAETFNHESSSGNLKGKDITTVKAAIDLNSGNVSLKNFSGEVDGETSSGNVTVEIEKFQNDFRWEASSGNIELTLPEDAGFNLNSHTSSGDVKTMFPIEVTGEIDKELKGTVGSGENDIELHTSSGDIRIKK